MPQIVGQYQKGEVIISLPYWACDINSTQGWKGQSLKQWKDSKGGPCQINVMEVLDSFLKLQPGR